MATQEPDVIRSKGGKSLIDLDNLYFPDNLVVSSAGGSKSHTAVDYEHLVHFFINETKTTTNMKSSLLGNESTDKIVPRGNQSYNVSTAGGAVGTATTTVQSTTDALTSVAAAKVVRTKTVISLPMPQNIATTYINGWNMENNDPNNMVDAIRMIEGQPEYMARNQMSKSGLMTATMKAATGKSVYGQSAMVYQGPVARTFQFQWDFYPTSPSESKRLWSIIQMFKWCSMGELISGGRFLHVPNTFDIEFRHRGKKNDFLPMSSTCALVNMSVTYTPMGHWAAFDPFQVSGHGQDSVQHSILQGLEGAPPVGITLALDFAELDLLTKNKIDPDLDLTFNTTSSETGSASAGDRGFY